MTHHHRRLVFYFPVVSSSSPPLTNQFALADVRASPARPPAAHVNTPNGWAWRHEFSAPISRVNIFDYFIIHKRTLLPFFFNFRCYAAPIFFLLLSGENVCRVFFLFFLQYFDV